MLGSLVNADRKFPKFGKKGKFCIVLPSLVKAPVDRKFPKFEKNVQFVILLPICTACITSRLTPNERNAI